MIHARSYTLVLAAVSMFTISSCSTYRVVDNNVYRALRADSEKPVSEKLIWRAIGKDPNLLSPGGTVTASGLTQTAFRTKSTPELMTTTGMTSFEVEALKFQVENLTSAGLGQKRADYALPATEGLIPSIFQGFEDASDKNIAFAATGKDPGSVFKSILDAIAKGTAFEMGGIVNGGEITTVAGVDLFNIRFGGNDDSALGGLGLKGFGGTTVTDSEGEAGADVALAVGLHLPLGKTGGLTLGFGTARSGDEWNEGVYFSINLAASSGQN